MGPRGSPEDPKVTALRAARCLNPHPEQVSDPTFRAEEFFDARDVVQVKYEMIRRVSVEGDSVTTAAAAFGYSRPSYYAAAAALGQAGLEGLVAAKPGPRAGHKLTDAVLTWAEQQLAADPGLRPAGLVQPIAERFAVHVHPRSVERPPAGAVQKPLTQPPTIPGHDHHPRRAEHDSAPGRRCCSFPCWSSTTFEAV